MENLDPVAWIKRAKYDLKAAEHDAEGELFDHAVFWCQQAAEKALKAVYIKKFSKLLKIHELVYLARAIGAPPELLNLCEDLNPYYIQTRYPDYEETLSEEEAQKAIRIAEKVVKWAEKNL